MIVLLACVWNIYSESNDRRESRNRLVFVILQT